MSVAGIILAAGESRRMGAPKALLELAGVTFLDRLISVFAVYCNPVIVVLGAHAEQIRMGTRQGAQVQFAVNPDYGRGQLSSLQCGMAAVPEGAEGLVFTLVDHPSITPATVGRLLELLDVPLAIPRYRGRRGHPVFVSRNLLPEFLALPPDAQARYVLDRHAAEIRYVDVDDSAVIEDIDEPDQYRRLRDGVSGP